jgi:hypothetical protein
VCSWSRKLARHSHKWRVPPTPLPNHLAPRSHTVGGSKKWFASSVGEGVLVFGSRQPASNFSCLVPRVVPRAQPAPVLLDQGSRCPCTRRSESDNTSFRFQCGGRRGGEGGGGAKRMHVHTGCARCRCSANRVTSAVCRWEEEHCSVPCPSPSVFPLAPLFRRLTPRGAVDSGPPSGPAAACVILAGGCCFGVGRGAS